MYLVLQLGSVKAGDMFSYTVPDTYRMSTRNGIEDKAQIIQSSDEIIVYVSNKQVNCRLITSKLYNPAHITIAKPSKYNTLQLTRTTIICSN